MKLDADFSRIGSHKSPKDIYNSTGLRNQSDFRYTCEFTENIQISFGIFMNLNNLDCQLGGQL